MELIESAKNKANQNCCWRLHGSLLQSRLRSFCLFSIESIFKAILKFQMAVSDFSWIVYYVHSILPIWSVRNATLGKFARYCCPCRATYCINKCHSDWVHSTDSTSVRPKFGIGRKYRPKPLVSVSEPKLFFFQKFSKIFIFFHVFLLTRGI